MRRSELGLILRLTGPLIQIACLLLLFGTPAGQSEVAGIRLAWPLYGGFFLGFALVVVGLVLSRRPNRPR